MTKNEIIRRASAWIVPPACQGQFTTVSYAYDTEGEGLLFRRVADAVDGTEIFAVADAADCGCTGPCDCFSPANREPTAFDWQPIGEA